MIAIICPITSRGCSPSVADQPVFHALLPSLEQLGILHRVKLFWGYDNDDLIWQRRANRRKVPGEWITLHGLTGKITSIWNALAARASAADYAIPANDDLVFHADPLIAVDVIDSQNGLGTCAFSDAAFPDLPTFYMVGRLHFDIFSTLYPLPWEGAHQDPWIADVYRPWKASAIDERIRVHNRIGIEGPRFEYGQAPGYREAVLEGRRRVNRWLAGAPNIAEPLPDATLEETPLLPGLAV